MTAAASANFALADALVQRFLILPMDEKFVLAGNTQQLGGDERLQTLLGLIAQAEADQLGRGGIALSALALGLIGLTGALAARATQKEVLEKAVAALRLYIAGVL